MHGLVVKIWPSWYRLLVKAELNFKRLRRGIQADSLKASCCRKDAILLAYMWEADSLPALAEATTQQRI